MTGFILTHLVNGVVDRVEVLLFRQGGDAFLVLTRACFGFHTLLQVRLRIPYYVTQQFSEFGSVLCLFPSVTLESFGYLRITFAVSLTAHGQIHTHLGAFAHKVSVQAFQDHWIDTFSYT